MSKYVWLFQFWLIGLLAVIVIVGCDNSSVDPEEKTDEAVGQLRLVPLSTNDLSKVITDENGQQWLPKSEMLTVLAKAAAVDIYYGELKATRTLQYVLMNVGNQDVFDIHFNAQDLYIYPETIGLIPASTQGAELSALPIVNIIKEHVIPIEGVGTLLEMSVGAFMDTLIITYHYITDGDTIEVLDDYDVGGTKMGVIIKPTLADKSLFESPFLRGYEMDDISQTGTVSFLNPDTFEYFHITNVGNVPIEYQMELHIWHHDNTIIHFSDGNILPDTYLDIDFINEYFTNFPLIEENTLGGYVIIIDFGPTPYIIGIENHSFLEGNFQFWIDFLFEPN